MGSTTIYQREPATVCATPAGNGQMYLVANPAPCADPAKSVAAAYEQMADLLVSENMQVVHERLFGSLSAQGVIRDARARSLGARGLDSEGPLTYIQGHPAWGEGFAGAILRAVSTAGEGNKVWTIRDGERPCGRGWRRNGASFVIVQNLHGLEEGSEADNSRPRQAERMIARAERILEQEGLSYRDVVRTWFYLSNILDWYGEFNKARSAKYAEFGLCPSPETGRLLLPASTGISGDLPLGAAGALDLLASADAPDARPEIIQMTNVRQQDAFQYGSSFSRGALIREEDVVQVQVSGTAAIDEKGVSIFLDDMRGQIERTFDNVDALLEPVGGTLRNVCAATIFVKRPEDAEVYRKITEARGLAPFPAVCVVADVCRGELLFEMDGEVAFEPR